MCRCASKLLLPSLFTLIVPDNSLYRSFFHVLLIFFYFLLLLFPLIVLLPLFLSPSSSPLLHPIFHPPLTSPLDDNHWSSKASQATNSTGPLSSELLGDVAGADVIIIDDIVGEYVRVRVWGGFRFIVLYQQLEFSLSRRQQKQRQRER